MQEAVSAIILYAPFLLFIAGFVFYAFDIVKHYRQGEIFKLKPSKARFYDFAILVLRWYLAYYMLNYGWSKITGNQFGVSDISILDKPLKEISKFQLAWYLFSLDKTFDIAVGLTQIIAAILIVFNRTALVGTLLMIPILAQIFFVDLAFTTEVFGIALPIRLLGMLASAFLILFYYRDRMILVWQKLTNGTTTRFKYKWWVFILLPLLGLLTDFGIALLTYPLKLLIQIFFNR